MKKIIFTLILLFFSIEFSKADPVNFEIITKSINELVKNDYHIKFVQKGEKGQIFVLEKNKDIIICQVIIVVEKTWCYKP